MGQRKASPGVRQKSCSITLLFSQPKKLTWWGWGFRFCRHISGRHQNGQIMLNLFFAASFKQVPSLPMFGALSFTSTFGQSDRLLVSYTHMLLIPRSTIQIGQCGRSDSIRFRNMAHSPKTLRNQPIRWLGNS